MTTATYRATMLTGKGEPDMLVTQDLPLEPPGPGQLRVRVLATGVGSTDVTMRRGRYLFAPKLPFVPGYESVGTVDAIGDGVSGFAVGDRVCALLVHGGYAEYVTRDASDWIKVPDGLDTVEVTALILNYVTAYQAIHRTARLAPGSTALVTGAAGGCGQAFVQLLRAHGVRVIAAASPRSHDLLRALGAEPIDGRGGRIAEAVHELVPGGVDAAFDGIGGDTLRQCIAATRKRGTIVWYGFMGATGLGAVLRNVYDLFVGARLRGRRAKFYGITALYRRDKRPFHDDLPQLFELLAKRRIQPRIALQLPLDQARDANIRIEAGGVDGKIVLVAAA